MQRELVLVCTLVLVVTLQSAARSIEDKPKDQTEARYRCSGRNEIYTKCGSACPETCESILVPNRACIALCVPGCFCKPGYVRNRWNTCIPREKCPCKQLYETFKCGNCENSCDPSSPSCLTNNPTKPANCTDGCYCLDGYARDSNDKCIPSEKCSKNIFKIPTTTANDDSN